MQSLNRQSGIFSLLSIGMTHKILKIINELQKREVDTKTGGESLGPKGEGVKLHSRSKELRAV